MKARFVQGMQKIWELFMLDKDVIYVLDVHLDTN